MSFDDDFDMTEDEFDALCARGEPVEVVIGPSVAATPRQPRAYPTPWGSVWVWGDCC